MKIHERHEEVGNPNNFQERIIDGYDFFEEYIKNIQNDKSKNIYPSLPRQAQIVEMETSDNTVKIKFFHSSFNKYFYHIAHVVK